MNELFNEMQSKGRVSFEDWLEKAIRQHPDKVTLKLARTEPIRIPQCHAAIYKKWKVPKKENSLCQT